VNPVTADRGNHCAEERILVRGIYTAASGAIVAQSNVDVIANNLANVNTTGFKRTLMQIEAGPKTAIFRDQTDPGQTSGNRTAGAATHASVGDLGFGARIYDTPAVFDQGAIQQTGNSLDVALSGPGFMAVRDASGSVSYTRGGGFVQNAQGALVTAEGDSVLGTDGKAIVLPRKAACRSTAPARSPRTVRRRASSPCSSFRIWPRCGRKAPTSSPTPARRRRPPPARPCCKARKKRAMRT